MVSVFIEAVPANVRIAKAVCDDNRGNNAHYTSFGLLIRLRGDKKLVLRRGIIEAAIGRRLTENEWQSVTWNYLGTITRLEHNEIVFEDSEESIVMDAYWDKQMARYKKNTPFY